MTIVANSQGVVTGKFTVPAGLPAGAYTIEAVGQGGSRGSAIFEGQGTLVRKEFQQQTTVTETRWQSPPPPPPIFRSVDPLAQTFTLDANTQVTGVDLWFSAIGTTPLEIQIRETSVGFPTSTVLARKRMKPSAIAPVGSATRVVLDQPIYLRGGQEYAIVVACDDAVSALSIAELGKFDPTAQKWVSEQSYRFGVLLSSSNASTWTPHQERDLAFRILGAHYTAATRTVQLGKVAVSDATDLLLMSYAERPTSSALVEYQLTLPDTSVLTVSDGQPVRLAAPITGNILISAVLHGTADVSPVLLQGTQLVVGRVAETANYVSRAVPAGQNVRVKVVYEAFVPAGASVSVLYEGIDAGDAWAPVPMTGAVNADDGWMEFTHEVTGVDETMVHAKIELTGTSAARPRVRNFRMMVL